MVWLSDTGEYLSEVLLQTTEKQKMTLKAKIFRIYFRDQIFFNLDKVSGKRSFFDYMRLLLKVQFILHETITDIYKLDYYNTYGALPRF